VFEVELPVLDFGKHFVPVLALEGQVATHEHVQQNSEGPAVAFAIVLSLQDLWSHVVWGTSDSLQLLVSLLPLGEAEVDQLQLIRLRDHDVLWLNIPMDNTLCMHVIKGTE